MNNNQPAPIPYQEVLFKKTSGRPLFRRGRDPHDFGETDVTKLARSFHARGGVRVKKQQQAKTNQGGD